MATIQNIPQLRFPQFDKTWETITLGDLLTFKNGLNSDKEKYGKGIKFINVLDILNNDFITYDKIIGSVEVTEKEFERNEVYYGDILFQRSSETRAEVGQANVYLDKNKSSVFGGFVIRGKAKREYNPSFMNYLLRTPIARKEITDKSGGSTRYNVGQDTLSQVQLTTTSLPEQQKIATFLTAFDEKIQQVSRQKELLGQYKKGVMQQLFSGKLRFKDENGNDYADWEEKKLGEVARITTGSSNRQDSNLDGEYAFFDRSQDIRSSNIFLFDTEAIIVPGEGQEFIPKYFIGKFDLHQRTYAIMEFGNNIGKFLYYYISYNSNHLNSHAVGSTVKSLRLPMFEKMPIKLPSLKEQQKIANFLTSIDVKTESTNQEINQMQNFKKGLLQQLFV